MGEGGLIRVRWRGAGGPCAHSSGFCSRHLTSDGRVDLELAAASFRGSRGRTFPDAEAQGLRRHTCLAPPPERCPRLPLPSSPGPALRGGQGGHAAARPDTRAAWRVRARGAGAPAPAPGEWEPRDGGGALEQGSGCWERRRGRAGRWDGVGALLGWCARVLVCARVPQSECRRASVYGCPCTLVCACTFVHSCALVSARAHVSTSARVSLFVRACALPRACPPTCARVCACYLRRKGRERESRALPGGRPAAPW